MDLVHEFKTGASPQAVYDAFTTEKGINGWWSKSCDMAHNEGETLKVRFTEHNVEMVFQIQELVPMKKAKWLATENANPTFLNTEITFEIQPEGSGSNFRFSHTNWDEQWEGKPNYEQSAETWKHFMNSLKSYLESGQGQPW